MGARLRLDGSNDRLLDVALSHAASRSRQFNFYRTYDPSTGRYLEPDPIGLPGGLNLYRYAANNPIGFRDPFGLFDTRDFVGNYFTWDPAPIDLGAEGLDSAFENSSSVRNEVSAFSAALDQEARGVAQNACGGCPSGDSTTVGFSLARPSTTNVRGEPGLYAVGSSTFFRRGSCSVSVDCKTGKYSYACSSTFSIRDSFTDPLEGREAIGRAFEIPFGSPYPITHQFNRNTSGGGRL